MNLLWMVAYRVRFLDDVELHCWLVVVVQRKQECLLRVNVAAFAVSFGECHVCEAPADGTLRSLQKTKFKPLGSRHDWLSRFKTYQRDYEQWCNSIAMSVERCS